MRSQVALEDGVPAGATLQSRTSPSGVTAPQALRFCKTVSACSTAALSARVKQVWKQPTEQSSGKTHPHRQAITNPSVTSACCLPLL